MSVRKIFMTVSRQIVPIRADMVVDHIEHHGEPAEMGLVDKSLQRLVITVDMRGGIQIDPVVCPVPSTGKFRDRHDFNDR